MHNKPLHRIAFGSRCAATLTLMEFSVLAGKRLLSLRLMSVGTHPAWVDSSTPQIATYAANLELAGKTRCVQVCPCEVEIPGRYPALGIELREWPEAPGIQRWDGGECVVVTPEELQQLLPATIEDIRLWDSMGEGPLSALDLVLSSGATLTLRHVFPPMMLGLDVHIGAAMSFNMPIDTDPQQQEAASPQRVVVRPSSR